MKSLTLSLILMATMQLAFAQYNNPNQTVYEKLADVNKQWLKKPREAALQSNATFATDEALIRFHLQQVEARLRTAGTAHLSATQKANRATCLDDLHTYWQAGTFPKNTHHSVRTPYFIDDYGTYCAVGYLIQQSGHQAFAQRIHDENNYAYIHEMEYPELLAWADEYGFSVDELAWIQPGYATPPPYAWETVPGSDVTEAVTTIEVDETNGIMYVAAGFGAAGNGIMSFDGTNWNDMDDGVNGTVAVILIDGQNVIVGGNFTSAGTIQANSIAVWNGNEWSALGSGLDGTVKALAYYNDELYAGGDFLFSSYHRPLAKWNGSTWAEVAGAPQGVINALKEYKKVLYAGGDFIAAGGSKNLVRMSETGFTSIGGYPTVVRALEVAEDINNTTDTTLLLYIGGGLETNNTTYDIYGFSRWNGIQMQHTAFEFIWYNTDSTYYVNSIKKQGHHLFVTGSNISFSPMYGYYGTNAIAFFTGDQTDPLTGGLTYGVNGAISAAVKFKGALVVGGEFDTLSNQPANKLALSGELETSIRQPVKPATTHVAYEQGNTVIYLNNPGFDQVRFVLFDAAGKQVMNVEQVQHARVAITHGALSTGIYLYSFNVQEKNLGTGNIFVR